MFVSQQNNGRRRLFPRRKSDDSEEESSWKDKRLFVSTTKGYEKISRHKKTLDDYVKIHSRGEKSFLKKKRRVSLVDQRVIDCAKGILRDEAFSSSSIVVEKKRRPSNLCVVREKEERRQSFGALMLNMLTREWTGRISRESSEKMDEKQEKRRSFEDLIGLHDQENGSERSLRNETLENVRRILWDEVNESPVKPEKSQSKRRPSLLLAAKRSARRRRESFQIRDGGDDDRKIDTSPVQKAARRSSIRRFGSRRGSMNSLRRLSKIAMKRST